MDVRRIIDVDTEREHCVTHLSKVLWSEGVFLRPQHLQCQDLYFEERMQTVARAVHPFPWGVRKVVAAGMTANVNAVSLLSLDVILPTGEHVCAPMSARLPSALSLHDITPKLESFLISVVLPMPRDEGNNCALDVTPGRRYVAKEVQAVDTYGDAALAPVHLASFTPRLVLDMDAQGDVTRLPILRLRRASTGHFEIDETFIPPSLTVDASPALFKRLERLLTILLAKAAALMAENAEPLQGAVAFRAGDHASFWLLHTVSSASAALQHLSDVRGIGPEKLHQELLRLAGGLMAFSRSHRLSDLPAYVHGTSHEGFESLFDIVTRLVDTVIPTKFVPIALEKSGTSYFSGRIDAEKIDASSTLYFGVSAGAIGQDLAAMVPLRFKIGAPEDVEKAVTSALPCVTSNHLTQPPAALPVKPGYTYFVLDSRGAPYERMLKGGSVRIFTPSGMDGLQLEMFAVTA